MSNGSLLYPTLNADPLYVQGIEYGILYAQMQATDEPIEQFFTRRNQEQILFLANRMGWSVETIEPQDDEWFWCRLAKKAG